LITQSRLWTVLALLAVAGIGTSAYLTYSHYADDPTVCAGIGSCEFVQTSKYSEIAGVPVAFMGLVYFVVLLGLCIARPLAVTWEPVIRVTAFTITVGSALFVSYLTYIELFVIDAICIWCVATAAITIACFGVLVLIVVLAEQPDDTGQT
jgi:uncharacterized membrane protein